MMAVNRSVLPLALFLALLPAGTGMAQEKANDDPSDRPAAPPRDVLQETDRPLDPRIDPDRITLTDPPPLPERVILPKPPIHRIAESGDQAPISEEHWTKALAAIDRGLAYLQSKQAPDGSWLGHVQMGTTDDPQAVSPVATAVTALAVKAMAQRGGQWAGDPAFQRALRFILRQREDDGSFGGGALSNYVTSAVVMGLASAGTEDFYNQVHEAVDWLEHSQWDQNEGLSPRHDWFGGAGYGNRGRPDLSNTQMMLDAVYDAGMSPDEPAFQRALAFISRAQNLRQTNSAAWAGHDGGFVYTPANGGESMASEAAGEGRHGELIAEGQPRSLRSYGSMTYAGFKSMLYAGLSPDDVRVRACFDWIRNHWTFDENPGLGQQGLYYYLHTMARALAVAQQHEITDAEGCTHNWREELIDALLSRQREDGSWVNQADRWLEGEPVMATVDALLALEEALKPALIVE